MAVVNETPDVRQGGDGDLDTAALFALVWDAVADGARHRRNRRDRAARGRAGRDGEPGARRRRHPPREARIPLHAAARLVPRQAGRAGERAPIAFRALVARDRAAAGGADRNASSSAGSSKIPALRACGLVWRAKETN